MPNVTRLLLDFVAAGLLLVGLSYWWLGNEVHEIAGVGFFLLLALHNVFNRRWWGTVGRERHGSRRRIAVTINLAILGAVLALLVTSLLISETVFGFLGLVGGSAARRVHLLAAYWLVVIAALHLGMNWTRVMGVTRRALGVTRTGRALTALLRFAALAVCVMGLKSSFEMAVGSKLVSHPTLDMWNFDDATSGFFLRYGSIMGLYATLAHVAFTWLKRRGSGHHSLNPVALRLWPARSLVGPRSVDARDRRGASPRR